MSLTLAARPLHRSTGTDSQRVDPLRAWLGNLVAAELPPFSCAPPAGVESRLLAEIHAATRAAACPDLFIVHAPDIHVGERVIADIARLSKAGRVLILTPDPTAADRIVEQLARASVIRALADDENPIRPSSVVSKLTSSMLGHGKTERLKQEAAAAIAAAEAVLTQSCRAEVLQEQAAELEAEIAGLTSQREKIDSIVRVSHMVRTPSPSRNLFLETRQEKEAALEALRKQQAEVARKPGFFARLLGVAKHEATGVESRIQSLESEIASLAPRVEETQAQIDAETVAWAAEREKAIRGEIATLQDQADARIGERKARREQILSEVSAIGTIPPRADSERLLANTRNRLSDLTENAAKIASQSLREARIVVGIPASLNADPVFDQDTDGNPPFELLILDRAEELTEPDFIHLSKLATRWVLVGDTIPSEAQRSHLTGNANRNASVPEEAFATRLARILNRETWTHEAERLVCRLLHLTTEQRSWVTREPLFDRPEIELRFATNNSGEPVLAEVVFPATTRIADAKSFLFHQLGEVLLRPCGDVHWHHAPTEVIARCHSMDLDTDATWIELESGIREKVTGTGLAAFTSAISFDPAAGWDAQKAEAWLAHHLCLHSISRYADTSTRRR